MGRLLISQDRAKHQARATKTLSEPPSNGVRGNPKDIRDSIRLQGAREHNLKNISLEIPKKKFVIITGPSGSGKSTLAFDTLFAEGQRRYIESLSAYAKQFLHQLKKPDLDNVQGLCPSIAIQQKTISKNPRSTVGTITEIYDYMRLLYSRVGQAFCPHCQSPVANQSVQQILEQVLNLQSGSRLNIISIIAQKKKGEFAKEISDLTRSGHVRARIDGQDVSLELGMRLQKNKAHTFEVYVDRLILNKDQIPRLDEAIQTASQLGQGHIVIEVQGTGQRLFFSQSLSCSDCGFSLPEMSPRLFSFNSPLGACDQCRGLGVLKWEEESEDSEESADPTVEICPQCEGSRLGSEAKSVFLSGKKISEVSALSPDAALAFFKSVRLKGNAALIGNRIIQEIVSRLEFLNLVGLSYLSLDRSATTLSGGEEQRVRLATQLGIQLTGVLYILDEPSIGLHQEDNHRLIQALKSLKEAGNTVIVVEHDLDTILAADLVIDLGPGAGRSGGYVVDQAPPKKLRKGLTADFIRGREKIEIPKSRRKGSGKLLKIQGASLHNLKDIDVEFPLGTFNLVTGVSGSGKSSLVMDVLSKSLQGNSPYHCQKVIGAQEVERVIRVTQSPIGRTPRSNPATYINLFTHIRDLFAKVPLARQRGYRVSRFSFNAKGGRCEACQGAGQIKMEMHFLPNVRVECEECFGRRYNSQTLEVVYKGKNIHDILEMTFEEADEFFERFPQIQRKLKVMIDVGLGYLKIGQPATTLSGGEAQRIKLARELSKTNHGRSLYILDEPTTGLHLSDIRQLLKICHELVDRGNTIVMIEHHLDVIKSADFVIDLGPGGGEAGGQIMAAGDPESICKSTNSLTGKYLKAYLNK